MYTVYYIHFNMYNIDQRSNRHNNLEFKNLKYTKCLLLTTYLYIQYTDYMAILATYCF